jgi:hypothetical protein
MYLIQLMRSKNQGVKEEKTRKLQRERTCKIETMMAKSPPHFVSFLHTAGII